MKYTVHIGDKAVELFHENFDEKINVDDLTKVDTSNIFGEAVTSSASANRIGMLKSEMEHRMADLKLDLKVFESRFRSNLRKQAFLSKGFYTARIDNEDVSIKLTEKSLETCFEEDEEWIKLKKDFNTYEKNFNMMSSLHWSIQDKCRKLNGLVSGTTPEDFVAGMIEGKINGILITKK